MYNLYKWRLWWWRIKIFYWW